MIIEFDKMYAELICDDVPMKEYEYGSNKDHWDGEKSYSDDGFIVNYCMDKTVACKDRYANGGYYG